MVCYSCGALQTEINRSAINMTVAATLSEYLTNFCKVKRHSCRKTDPVLRRPSDPEEEDHQRGGQQLPDKQNHSKHNVTSISQRRLQVCLDTQMSQ